MDWILIGVVTGSLVTGTFPNKEACMGRVATLKEQKIEAKCVEAPNSTSGYVTGLGSGIISACCQINGLCKPC